MPDINTPNLIENICMKQFLNDCGKFETDKTTSNQKTEMEEILVRDSNGNILKEGDAVTIIKDLKVKGSSTTLKRGTVVKGIRLTDNNEEVEGCVNKEMMVLKAVFLKKV